MWARRGWRSAGCREMNATGLAVDVIKSRQVRAYVKACGRQAKIGQIARSVLAAFARAIRSQA